MTEWGDRRDSAIERVVRAHDRHKKAEAEADRHKDDFHFDPKYTEGLSRARRSLLRSLNGLEKVWNEGT